MNEDDDPYECQDSYGLTWPEHTPDMWGFICVRCGAQMIDDWEL